MVSHNVILFNPYSLWQFHLNFEIAIFHNLKSRGLDPIYVRCDLDSDVCDLYWHATTGPRSPNACNDCRNHTKLALEKAHIDYVSLSEFLKKDEVTEVKRTIGRLPSSELSKLEINGLNIQKLTEASVRSHFRVGALDPENLRHIDTLRSYLVFTIVNLLALSRILLRFRPAYALAFNGRMAPTAAFLALCDAHNVHVTTHERGMTRGSVSLIANGSCLSFEHYDLYSRQIQNGPLKSYEIQTIKDWIKDRRTGKNLNWKPFSVDDCSQRSYDIDSSCKLWVLYTSSIDETTESEGYTSPFGSQSQWIRETIRFVTSSNFDIKLIIRIHPNTGSRFSTGRNEPELEFFDYLANEISDERITFVGPDDLISSYVLMDKAHLVLCYSSTVSLESVLARKLCYLACRCSYSSCPGIVTPDKEPNYFEFLSRAQNAVHLEVPQADLVAAYRWVYRSYFEEQARPSFLIQFDAHNNALVFHNKNNFSLGMIRDLDDIVDLISSEKSGLTPNLRFCDDTLRKAEICAINDDNNNDIFISVVIVNYNYGDYIEKCLDSVLKQCSDDIEVIVVDDGSTDHSLTVIQQVVSKATHHRIVVLTQANSGQPAFPRNLGISSAQGKFILPLDSDDTIADGFLAGIRETASNNADADVIAGNCLYTTGEATSVVKPGLFSMGRLRSRNQLVIASAFKRSLFERVGGYRTNVPGYEDWDLWLNMACHGAKMVPYDGIGLVYTERATGLGNRAKKSHERLYAQVLLNNPLCLKYDLSLRNWALAVIAANDLAGC